MVILTPSVPGVGFSKDVSASQRTPTCTRRSSVIESVTAGVVLVSKVTVGACVSIALLKAGYIIMSSLLNRVNRKANHDDSDDYAFKRPKDTHMNGTDSRIQTGEPLEKGTYKDQQLLRNLLRDIGGDVTYSLPDEEEEDIYYSDMMEGMHYDFEDYYGNTDVPISIGRSREAAGQSPNSQGREIVDYLLSNKYSKHRESLLDEWYESDEGDNDSDVDFWPEVFNDEADFAENEAFRIMSDVIHTYNRSNGMTGKRLGAKVTEVTAIDSDEWEDMEEESVKSSGRDTDVDDELEEKTKIITVPQRPHSSTKSTEKIEQISDNSTSCSEEADDKLGEITRNTRLYFSYSPLSSEHQKARTFCLCLVDRTLLNMAAAKCDVKRKQHNARTLKEDLDDRIRKRNRNPITGVEIVKGEDDVELGSNPDCTLQVAERLEIYMRHCILYLAQELNIKVFHKCERASGPCVDCFFEKDDVNDDVSKRRISRPKDFHDTDGNDSDFMKKLLLTVQEYLEICVEIDRLKPVVVERSVEEQLNEGDVWCDKEEGNDTIEGGIKRVNKTMLSIKNGRRQFMDNADEDDDEDIGDEDDDNFKDNEKKDEMVDKKMQIFLSHKKQQELKRVGIMSHDPLQRLLDELDERHNLSEHSEEECDDEDEDEDWEYMDDEADDEEEHLLCTVHDINRRAFEAAIIRGLLDKLAPQTEIVKYSAALKNSARSYKEPYDPDASEGESDDGAGGYLFDRYLSGGVSREEYVCEKDKRRKQEESEENLSLKRRNVVDEVIQSGTTFLCGEDAGKEGNSKTPYAVAVTHLLANTSTYPQPIIASVSENISRNATNFICMNRESTSFVAP